MNRKKYIVALMVLFILLVGCSKNSIYEDNEEILSIQNNFNLDVKNQSIENQHLKGLIEKTEGIDTIWVYESNEDKVLDITYLLDVESGKVKLVLIDPDDSITNIIETSDKSEVTGYATSTLQIKKGINRIKIVVGKNTSAKFDITIPEGKFETLGM